MNIVVFVGDFDVIVINVVGCGLGFCDYVMMFVDMEYVE